MRWVLSGLSVVVVASVGAIVYLLAQPTGPGPNEQIAVAQQLVRNSLPSGLTIHFGDPVETSTEKLADDKYRVTGWVDLVPKNGEVSRQVYTCILHKSAGRNWVAEDITFMDQ